MLDNNYCNHLLEEISELKRKLESTFKKHKSLNHPDVVSVSMLLDEKIIQYTHLVDGKQKEAEINKENLN